MYFLHFLGYPDTKSVCQDKYSRYPDSTRCYLEMVRRHRATYSSQESTYLKAFFLPTSTGWQLIKHQSIFKNHMSFQIYAKRSFKCRWSHNATTIHRKMSTLQRQPSPQPKFGHFLTWQWLRKILNLHRKCKIKKSKNVLLVQKHFQRGVRVSKCKIFQIRGD